MPFTTEDVDKHIKGLTDKQKKQWVSIANSVYRSCEESGGKKCDVKAIIQANGVVGKAKKKPNKKMPDEEMPDKEKKCEEDKDKDDTSGDEDETVEMDCSSLGDLLGRLMGAKHTHKISNVKIFAAGKWNGDNYTKEDLNDLLASFGRGGFIPTLSLEHNPKLTEQVKDQLMSPALGVVTHPKIMGQHLVCDFEEVPTQLYDAIERKNYSRISAEIYWNYPVGDVIYKRVLKGVTLLGAQIPAVTGLDSLNNLYSYEEGGITVKRIDFELDTTVEEQTRDEEHDTVLRTDESEDTFIEIKEELNMADNKEKEKDTQVFEQKLVELSTQLETVKTVLSEKESLVKEYASTIEKLTGEVTAKDTIVKELQTKLDVISKEQREKDLKAYIADLKGKGKVLPAVEEKLFNMLVTATAEQEKQIKELFEGMPKAVEFSETMTEDKTILNVEDSEPMDAVDGLVKAFMEKNKDIDYETALDTVLKTHTELAQKYANSFNE